MLAQVDPEAANPDEALRRFVAGEVRAAEGDQLRETFEYWLHYVSSAADIAFLQRVFELVNISFNALDSGLITAILIHLPKVLLSAVGTDNLHGPRPEWSPQHAWAVRFAENDRGKTA